MPGSRPRVGPSRRCPTASVDVTQRKQRHNRRFHPHQNHVSRRHRVAWSCTGPAVAPSPKRPWPPQRSASLRSLVVQTANMPITTLQNTCPGASPIGRVSHLTPKTPISLGPPSALTGITRLPSRPCTPSGNHASTANPYDTLPSCTHRDSGRRRCTPENALDWDNDDRRNNNNNNNNKQCICRHHPTLLCTEWCRGKKVQS